MLPAKLLIHIGFHKTASSWLQRELFSGSCSAFKPLSDCGNSKQLSRHFAFTDEGYLLSPFQSPKNRFNKEVSGILEENDFSNSTAVISSEGLSGKLHSGGIDSKNIADRIKLCAPQAKIFAVIREQKSMILSTYLQYVKKGGIHSLRTYLKNTPDGRRAGFSPEYLKYIDLVSYYQQLFSPENVLILPYEMFRDKPKEFFARLAEFNFTKIDVENLNVGQVHNKAEKDLLRLKFPVLNLFSSKSALNAESPLQVWGMNRAIRTLNSMLVAICPSAYKRMLSSFEGSVDEFSRDRFKKSNEQLSKLIGLDLSKFGYH